MKTVMAVLLFCALQLTTQDMAMCPKHKEHMKEASQRQADVEKHGDQAMGFPHDKTTHHFHLSADGGAIEVTVNDSKDAENLRAIRMYLAHIATQFSNGDFAIPCLCMTGAAGSSNDERTARHDFLPLRGTANGREVRIKPILTR
jgi:hypothetical protein